MAEWTDLESTFLAVPLSGLGGEGVTGPCPFQQRPSDYGIPMDVEMAYVQDSFLTNDILHEMVSWLRGQRSQNTVAESPPTPQD